MCITYNWSFLTEFLCNPEAIFELCAQFFLCVVFCLVAHSPLWTSLSLHVVPPDCHWERGALLFFFFTMFLVELIEDDFDPLTSFLTQMVTFVTLIILFEQTVVYDLDHIHNNDIRKHEYNANMLYSVYGTCFLHLKCSINLIWSFYVCIVFRGICSP